MIMKIIQIIFVSWVGLNIMANIRFAQEGIKTEEVDQRVDWEGLVKDPEYKRYKWPVIPENLRIIEDSLANRKATIPQRIGVLTNIVHESGGSPKPHGNGAIGLIGWRDTRANNIPANLPDQIYVLMEEILNNPNNNNWTDGGKGSGYQTRKEAYQSFQDASDSSIATHAFMRGYVRPPVGARQKRIDFSKLLEKYFK